MTKSNPTAASQEARMTLVRDAYADMKARMEELRPALEQAVHELHEEEEITGARVAELLAQHGLP